MGERRLSRQAQFTGVGREAYVIFIVRDDRKADLIFQSSDMTWSSYNRWPQWRSLYDNGDDHWGASNGNPAMT
jgi:hypothetical protein